MSRHGPLQTRRRYSRLPSGEEPSDLGPVVTDCCAIPLGNFPASFCHVPSVEEILEPGDTEVRRGTVTLRSVFDKPASTPLAVRTTPVRRGGGGGNGRMGSYTGLCVSISDAKSHAFYGDVRNGLMSVGQLSVVSSRESGSSMELANCPSCCLCSVQQQRTVAKVPQLRRSRSNEW